MATETERKFLVAGDGWKDAVASAQDLSQGYLAAGKDVSVRVRIGRKAFVTVKGRGDGLSRPEFEYEIPDDDAAAMMLLCEDRTLVKRRHIVMVGEDRWEVDVFGGRLDGLVMAEIELESPDAPFSRPDWLGEEVTFDPRYLNQTLALEGLPGGRHARP